MKKVTVELEYEIGQHVYENFPEGQIGIIIGWAFDQTMELLYEVRWLDGDKEYCISDLLSDVKIYG